MTSAPNTTSIVRRPGRAWRAFASRAVVALATAVLHLGTFAQEGVTRNAPAGPAPAANIVDGGTISLVANRSTVLKTRVPFKNVSIAQPEVADVNLVGPTDILITAKKPGTTQLIIWDDENRSQVIDVNVTFDLQALQDQLAEMFPDSRIRVASLNGTIARHEYDFSRAIEGGETITRGNDIDTAPRNVHSLDLDLPLGEHWQAGFNVTSVGSYFLDAGNTAKYDGHRVANLRVGWRPESEQLRLTLRVDNVFDTAYADRADFAFGNYRYFPGRGRAAFLAVDYATN